KEKNFVRPALLAFISGIDFILGEANKLMNSRDAAAHIEKLDLDVARVLLSPGIDRSYYIRWSEVSLAPALGSERSRRVKEQAIRPFNPQIVLRSVTLS